MRYDVIVIGGGLAGCSAALQLAQAGHDVVLLEKESYPRHKLCGEFLSPEVQSSLRGLDMMKAVHDAGSRTIEHARLTAPSGSTGTFSLPGTALGLSRYRLDALLFRAASAAGVDGRTETRATAVHGSLVDGFTVQTAGETVEGRLVLGAYGRRGMLDRTLERPFLDERSPSVAFKAHYTGPPEALPDAIEVHAAPGGYCGIGPVEKGRVNVCWIGHTDALRAAGGTPAGMLNDALRENPVLDDRMHSLTRVSNRFEAVSQVPLMPKNQFVEGVCMIGDAAGMIAPLCGDGMAMALDTADLVTPLVHQVLTNRRSPESFRAVYRHKWKTQFRRRLRIGRWVHAAAVHPLAARIVLQMSRVLPSFARWLIRATRG